MKKIWSIFLILSMTMLLATCKKTPEIPEGSKIEIGQTTTDSLSFYTAKVSTTMTATGGNEISQHGHCWSKEKEPTTENNKTTLGKLSQPKTFTSELENLENTTTYYVRSYIIFSNGTIYGGEQTIQTLETRKPIVTTNEALNITINTATCGGVNDDGGLSVSQRGTCWNTTGDPTLENNIGFTTEGTGTGNYTSRISNLDEGTTYYVAAYATNEKGTGYGLVIQFNTLILELPTVTTANPTDIKNFTAMCDGTITSSGNGTISVRGICWNTTENPTLDNNIGFTSEGSGTGTFTSQLTGLTEYTTYYVAAYATNEKGTAYGSTKSFITKNDLYDSRDGQYYETVVIGYQTWMAENLNYNNGNNSWCYDGDPDNCDIYGRLYDWETIMNGESSSNSVPSGVQGICPDGWHVPSDAEWTVLADYLGGDAVAGGKMKEEGNEHWSYPNTNATNSSGFKGLPGGVRNSNGSFDYLGSFGYWWSTTEGSDLSAWRRTLYYDNGEVGRFNDGKTYGRSVRCVKD